jgi:outer membrane protein
MTSRHLPGCSLFVILLNIRSDSVRYVVFFQHFPHGRALALSREAVETAKDRFDQGDSETMLAHRFRSVQTISILFMSLCHERVAAQCSGIVSTPGEASFCAGSAIPDPKVAAIDRQHQYSLPELIDIGERNNPKTRQAWERTKQQAKVLGIERSEYFPVLAAAALFGHRRVVQPFPKPLSPIGYSVVDLPLVLPQLDLQYLLLDFGGRKARVDAAKAEALAAGALFIKANQDLAFGISNDYYALLTAQERLQAARETLQTAQTTQDAAEAKLSNGRATLPDVLNARAETAQASLPRRSPSPGKKTLPCLVRSGSRSTN